MVINIQKLFAKKGENIEIFFLMKCQKYWNDSILLSDFEYEWWIYKKYFYVNRFWRKCYIVNGFHESF